MLKVRSVSRAAGLIAVLGVLPVFGLGGPAQSQEKALDQERQPFVWPVVADPNVDPIVFAVSQQLDDPAVVRGYHPDDVETLKAAYKSRQEPPLWVTQSGLTERALAAKSALEKADHWGLEPGDYSLPRVDLANASDNQRAELERAIGLEVLKYVRHARSGRVRPTSVTRINDFPGLSQDDIALLWQGLAETKDVRGYLHGLHPQHAEFDRLRQALLKARGISEIETGALPRENAPAPQTGATVTLPSGADLTPGMQHSDVVLLRERLGVEADLGANAHYFDAPLATAVADFQKESGLVATGNLDQATRKRLNAALLASEDDEDNVAYDDDVSDAPQKNSRNVQLILNNMERWRWLPHDMGELYVWNNVPEFQTRVYKDDEQVFKERIVVGLPEWATPSFMADMKFIIFHPSWGVPRGIKLKELLPRLKRAQPQSIFDFFAGSSGTSAVFKAYNLDVYKNGQKINPNNINWNSSNILNYSFVQPPGGKNPLGIVKFRFPNKHNVYMHDTIEPELFAKSRRAYSHGCIRVRNPIKLAEVLIGHDKGYAPERVRRMARSGGSVTLERDIPVYTSYMTARVDKDGSLRTYGDIYGRDSRLARQLGRPMTFKQPKIAKPTTGGSSTQTTARKKKRAKKKKSAASKKSRVQSSVHQAISGRYH